MSWSFPASTPLLSPGRTAAPRDLANSISNSSSVSVQDEEATLHRVLQKSNQAAKLYELPFLLRWSEPLISQSSHSTSSRPPLVPANSPPPPHLSRERESPIVGASLLDPLQTPSSWLVESEEMLQHVNDLGAWTLEERGQLEALWMTESEPLDHQTLETLAGSSCEQPQPPIPPPPPSASPPPQPFSPDCGEMSERPLPDIKDRKHHHDLCFEAVYAFMEAFIAFRKHKREVSQRSTPLKPHERFLTDGIQLLMKKRRDRVSQLIGSTPLLGQERWERVVRAAESDHRSPQQREIEAALGSFFLPVCHSVNGVLDYANDIFVDLLELDREKLARREYWMVELGSEEDGDDFAKFMSMLLTGELSFTGVLSLHTKLLTLRSKRVIPGVCCFRMFQNGTHQACGVYQFLPNVQPSMGAVVSQLNDPFSDARKKSYASFQAN